MAVEIRIGSSLGFERRRHARPIGPRDVTVRLEAAQSVRIVHLLTPRETSILRELVREGGGAADKDIAAQLGISPGTVKVYNSRMLSKLGLNNRVELALWAERSGLFRSGVPDYVDFDLAA